MKINHYLRRIADLGRPHTTQLQDAIRYIFNISDSGDVIAPATDIFADKLHRKDIHILNFHHGMPDELGWIRYQILAEIKGFGVRKIQFDATNECFTPHKTMICNMSISTEKWAEYCIKDPACFYSIV